MNVVDGHEGVRIDSFNNLLETDDFITGEYTVQHFLLCAGKASLGRKKGSSPVHFFHDQGSDFGVFFGDDHRCFSGIRAFLHEINHPCADKYGDEGIHGFFIIEIDKREGNDDEIKHEHCFPHAPSHKFMTEPCNDIHSACCSAIAENNAESDADKNASEQGCEGHILFQVNPERRETLKKVKKKRHTKRTDQRINECVFSKQLPANKKKREVERQIRIRRVDMKQKVKNKGNAGKTAFCQIVLHVEMHDAKRKDGGAQQDKKDVFDADGKSHTCLLILLRRLDGVFIIKQKRGPFNRSRNLSNALFSANINVGLNMR